MIFKSLIKYKENHNILLHIHIIILFHIFKKSLLKVYNLSLNPGMKYNSNYRNIHKYVYLYNFFLICKYLHFLMHAF